MVTLLIVGGNSNNGSICGLTASNSNNGFSNSNANIGARLTFYWLFITSYTQVTGHYICHLLLLSEKRNVRKQHRA